MLGEYIAKVLFWFFYTFVARSIRPHQIIGTPDEPYLLRWWLFGTSKHKNKRGEPQPRRPFGLCLFLHCFVRSDHDEHHDHPWDWHSFILKGGYREHTKGDYFEAYHLPPTPAFVTDNRRHYDDPFDIAYDRYEGTLRSGKAADVHWVELYPTHETNDVSDLRGLSTEEVWMIGRLPPAVPCWSLFFMHKRERDWGFLRRDGVWVPWHVHLGLDVRRETMTGGDA